MKQDVSVTRLRLLLVGLALALVAVGGFLIGIFSAIKCGVKPGGPRAQLLNGTTMANIFRFQGSKACMFLAADGSRDEGMGQVQWVEEHPYPRNALLEENGRWIRVNESGSYLVFVQAVYKLNGCVSTQLGIKTVVKYAERTEEFSSIFETWRGTGGPCGEGEKGEEADVVLSHPVLLWMEKEDRLTVNATHRELMDYETRPISSFLTLFKYSD
ncbi:hypothetical protein MATL_G00086530 [Megalops atlanticus]|uniref:THD domain-containing protein n=1 Tax=Megalops atlanticus TaxID=7932 RepID=A0A9D3Q2U3_MEGAT|nr:hypothetical protein MATL_G00086530 [Megalops atlanticus]